jgi:hypothetical protein
MKSVQDGLKWHVQQTTRGGSQWASVAEALSGRGRHEIRGGERRWSEPSTTGEDWDEEVLTGGPLTYGLAQHASKR